MEVFIIQALLPEPLINNVLHCQREMGAQSETMGEDVSRPGKSHPVDMDLRVIRRHRDRYIMSIKGKIHQ